MAEKPIDPYSRLGAAVIQRAILDALQLRMNIGGKTASKKATSRAQANAIAWLKNEDDGPGTSNWAFDLIGADRDRFRKLILAELRPDSKTSLSLARTFSSIKKVLADT